MHNTFNTNFRIVHLTLTFLGKSLGSYPSRPSDLPIKSPRTLSISTFPRAAFSSDGIILLFAFLLHAVNSRTIRNEKLATTGEAGSFTDRIGGWSVVVRGSHRIIAVLLVIAHGDLLF